MKRSVSSTDPTRQVMTRQSRQLVTTPARCKARTKHVIAAGKWYHRQSLWYVMSIEGATVSLPDTMNAPGRSNEITASLHRKWRGLAESGNLNARVVITAAQAPMGRLILRE